MILLEKAKTLFVKTFKDDKHVLGCFSHGRMEIIGNHTDHNNGFAIVAGCDMGITAAFRKADEVAIVSEGFRPFRFNPNHLTYYKEQEGSSLSIVKGVMVKMKKLGYNIGGFEAALSSDILPGSGVSSSAAFEALIVKILLELYNKDKEMDQLTMAKVCHYAESKYFGKPCGLLDQIGACYGGIQFLDFEIFAEPKVEEVPFDLNCDFVLVISPSSHAKLTPYYAAIPADMESVASKMFGKRCLRECDREEFMRKLAVPTPGVSEIAKLRAQHYFDENIRVHEAKKAILNKDLPLFFRMLKESGFSSRNLLMNTMVPGIYADSPQEALDRAGIQIKEGEGAVRIHGGGFAGGILCVTLPENTDAFIRKMNAYYGKDHVRKVQIVEGGPCIVE